jgi:hypothetical protein
MPRQPSRRLLRRDHGIFDVNDAAKREQIAPDSSFESSTKEATVVFVLSFLAAVLVSARIVPVVERQIARGDLLVVLGRHADPGLERLVL